MGTSPRQQPPQPPDLSKSEEVTYSAAVPHPKSHKPSTDVLQFSPAHDYFPTLSLWWGTLSVVTPRSQNQEEINLQGRLTACYPGGDTKRTPWAPSTQPWLCCPSLRVTSSHTFPTAPKPRPVTVAAVTSQSYSGSRDGKAAAPSSPAVTNLGSFPLLYSQILSLTAQPIPRWEQPQGGGSLHPRFRQP